MSEATALIEYIGKQTNRKDDVRIGSGRVWKAAGDVVEVLVSEKGSYLAHPGEWREITREQMESRKQAEVKGGDLIAQVMDLIPELPSETLREYRDLIGKVLIERGHEEAPKAELVDAPVVPAAAGAAGANAARLEQIAAAVRELDPNNPEHYTQQGNPRVPLVKEMTKLDDVTLQEVQDAVAALKG